MSISFKFGGTAKDAAEWNISKAELNRRDAACDELQITFADMAAAHSFSSGDTVEILENGIRRFYGKIAKLPQTLSGTASNAALLAKGPWADLEGTVYQQAWTASVSEYGEPQLGPVMRSKVVLGQSADGAKISVARQVRDILEYALACGADFQIGEISIDAQMLFDEAKDLSCAEALARTLKWAPNTSIYFDYAAQGMPRINVKAHSALAEKSIAQNSGSVKKISVCARPDLSVSGVSIKYETENTAGDNTWLSVKEDSFPSGFNSASKKALVMSVELAGLRSFCQTHKIECESVMPSSQTWWRKRVPSLADNAEFEVVSYGRSHSALPRELVSGTISPRMNFQTESDKVYATIRLTDENGSVSTRDIAVKITATNASTGTYDIWTATQFAEEIPQGLAQAVYESARTLLYEGSATIIGAKSEDFMGRKISVISPENPDWGAMDSPAVSTREDMLKSLVTLRFGPPKHLYPDNIAELFRINRPRKVPSDAGTRSSGKVSAARVEFDGFAPDTNGGQGDSKYSRMIISAAEEENSPSIDLDSALLDSSEKMSVRELLVCKDGRLARAKFLMTEPVFEEEEQ